VGSNSIEISQEGITVQAIKIGVTATTTLELSGLSSKLEGQEDLALSGGMHAALSAALVEIN
jgi:hypothetical protein